AGRGAAAVVVAARVARVPGQAVRARGGAASARAPSRLEGDLLGRGAGGAARAGTPGAGLRSPVGVAGPVRRDGRCRAAGATAGRRHRDIPRRRPAREDRAREHGPLTRGAGAVPRPGRRRSRVRAADVAEGAGAREEAGPPPRGGGPGAARDRARPEARLLDPGGGVAARRTAPVRAGRPLARRAAPGRLLPAGRGDTAARRARARPRGPLTRAVGPALLPAVAGDGGGWLALGVVGAMRVVRRGAQSASAGAARREA